MNEVIFTLAAEIEWFNLVRLHRDRFERPFDQTIRLLRGNPQMGIETRVAPLRRVLVSRTAWGIFYAVTGNRIVIVSILDLRQDPQTIKNRLRDLLP